MFHTVGFRIGTISNTPNTQVTAVQDGALSIRNGAFFIPQPMKLLYGYFGSGNSLRARFATPSWRVISNPQIRPVSSAILPPSPSLVADWRTHPLTIPSEQEFSLEGTDPTGTGVGIGVAGLQVQPSPAPSRDIFTIRAVATTTAVAGAWTQVTLTYDDDLPPGQYVVVGMNAIGATLVAARLILSGQFWRPGCIGNAVADIAPDPMFRMGRLGSWGQFDNTVLPNVEVFCNAADTAQTIFLDIAKL